MQRRTLTIAIERNTLPPCQCRAFRRTSLAPASRVKTKADGQLHGWRSSNEVQAERYHRPDAPVLGCWIRVKLNAASRCDHWDAVMARLVLRGQGQGVFLQRVKRSLMCECHVEEGERVNCQGKVDEHGQIERAAFRKTRSIAGCWRVWRNCGEPWTCAGVRQGAFPSARHGCSAKGYLIVAASIIISTL